jgi:hypothetical protein
VEKKKVGCALKGIFIQLYYKSLPIFALGIKVLINLDIIMNKKEK